MAAVYSMFARYYTIVFTYIILDYELYRPYYVKLENIGEFWTQWKIYVLWN